MYVYIPKNNYTNVFLVGFYIPTGGNFVVESEQTGATAAAARVSYLNGGSAPS